MADIAEFLATQGVRYAVIDLDRGSLDVRLLRGLALRVGRETVAAVDALIGAVERRAPRDDAQSWGLPGSLAGLTTICPFGPQQQCFAPKFHVGPRVAIAAIGSLQREDPRWSSADIEQIRALAAEMLATER
jgi:hypothetical protein